MKESLSDVDTLEKGVGMFCWGSTSHGELGLGGIEEEQILVPRELTWPDQEVVKFAACGETHSVMITDQGKIYSCGNNDFGQLGHDQPRKRPRMSMFSMLISFIGLLNRVSLFRHGRIRTCVTLVEEWTI